MPHRDQVLHRCHRHVVLHTEGWHYIVVDTQLPTTTGREQTSPSTSGSGATGLSSQHYPIDGMTPIAVRTSRSTAFLTIFGNLISKMDYTDNPVDEMVRPTGGLHHLPVLLLLISPLCGPLSYVTTLGYAAARLTLWDLEGYSVSDRSTLVNAG